MPQPNKRGILREQDRLKFLSSIRPEEQREGPAPKNTPTECSPHFLPRQILDWFEEDTTRETAQVGERTANSESKHEQPRSCCV